MAFCHDGTISHANDFFVSASAFEEGEAFRRASRTEVRPNRSLHGDMTNAQRVFRGTTVIVILLQAGCLMVIIDARCPEREGVFKKWENRKIGRK